MATDVTKTTPPSRRRRSRREPTWKIAPKRIEYAAAGIPEYWIVDPQKKTIAVLVLKARAKVYSEYGVFQEGTQAVSKLLPGFAVDFTTVLSQKP